MKIIRIAERMNMYKKIDCLSVLYCLKTTNIADINNIKAKQ